MKYFIYLVLFLEVLLYLIYCMGLRFFTLIYVMKRYRDDILKDLKKNKNKDEI